MINTYEQDFLPAVRITDNYAVLTTSGTWRFFNCLYVEPLPASSADLVYDAGAIAADSVSRANAVTILEVEGSAKNETDVSEVAQLRFYPIDDIAIAVKQPAASGRFKTRSNEIRVDYKTIELDPTLKSTEIYVYEDDTINVDVYNLTNYALTQSRIQFFGWRIVGSQLAQKPDKLTYLAASGYQR